MEPGANSVTASKHMFADCGAKCQRGYWKEFTSRLWPTDWWCLWFFLGSCIPRVYFSDLFGTPSGACVDKILLLGEVWPHTSSCWVHVGPLTMPSVSAVLVYRFPERQSLCWSWCPQGTNVRLWGGKSQFKVHSLLACMCILGLILEVH